MLQTCGLGIATNGTLCLFCPKFLGPIYDSFFQVTRVCEIHMNIRFMLSLVINLVKRGGKKL